MNPSALAYNVPEPLGACRDCLQKPVMAAPAVFFNHAVRRAPRQQEQDFRTYDGLRGCKGIA
ncbi:hypothetical protein KOEU_08880 [Komagataeibacter europaeus]|uniref:Uncharacterized protein n=1 Tax=Komagataeibacter europaeus TaxID=33995 RepID=A0A0M0EK19_KOMEU|nr:hypothetical protein S101446_02337 [Komagataeibacter europaeus]KON65612.1 hypothetical protein KOEU_08880 [Komagataeibacter europaeus]